MVELQYYLKISNHLAGELDIRSALSAVKQEIDKIIEVDHLDVCLTDDDKYCNTSYEVGLRTSWSTTRTTVAVSPVRDILLGYSDTMLTGDATKDPRYTFPGACSEPIIRHGLHSRINVAMKVLGRTIGSLNCSSGKKDFYTQEHLEQVKILADILAPYFFALRSSETAKQEAVQRAKDESRLEGLRIGALKLTQALEAERQRIGMDLHDQTLGDLTLISRNLRPGVNVEEINALRQQTLRCIQHVRGIIDSSIPSILEFFGFEEAVRSHVENLQPPDRPFHLLYDDTSGGVVDQLDETQRIALFRICQEALNNSIRHSLTDQVSLDLYLVGSDRLAIRISDTGRFVAPAPARSGGLTHMRTRADLIGADFDIDISNGTVVKIELQIG